MVINPIVGFNINIQNSRLCTPNIRIPMDSPIECGMTIPYMATFDPGTYEVGDLKDEGRT